jgi:exo-beta-1,3-glucanase (GH17 family)
MAVQPGNTSRLNVVKGCSQLLEVDSSDTSLLDKVLPANMLLKDRATGGLYLTDGLHNLSYVFANSELLSDSEMTATEVANIANQILYTNDE